MDATLIGFIAYLVVVLVIGFVASSRNKTNEDWLLGGRSINGYLLAFSERASGESAWLLLGLPAAALTVGLGEAWTALGSVIGILCSWIFISEKIRAASANCGALTLPELLSSMFSNCRIILLLGALVSMFFYTFYVSSGFAAAGTILNATFGMEKGTGIMIGAAVVLTYTILGGFVAVVWTDMIQAILMVATLVILPVAAIMEMGGVGVFLDRFSALTSTEITSWTHGETGVGALLFILAGASWGFGYVGQPHLLTRFMAMPSREDVRKGFRIASAWVVPAFGGAVLLGLIAIVAFTPEQLTEAGILGEGANSDKLMPFFAKYYVPAWLAGILICGAIAAMMSTADTQLLVVSSAVCEDIYHKTLRQEPGEAKLLLISRVMTTVVCLCAFYLAYTSQEIIFQMVSYAWGGLGSTFGPLVVLSLYWKSLTRNGVIAGLLFGSLGTILWKNTAWQAVAPERFSIFLLNFLVIIAVSLLTRDRQQTASTGS
ncbi:sodium/proline symporter [bacterium]|jgi:sodium/proline symporter|nr:sodium/proline symporter [bacterium]